jgi:hypothetical protein
VGWIEWEEAARYEEAETRNQAKERCAGSTYSSPGGHKIDLVQHVDEVLVCLFFSKVFDDRLAPCAERITGVQDMNDDVRGIENLVQFSPYTT